MKSSFDYDVIIAGGGPAGASAAIHLSTLGARVLLAEQKKFPRAKLCGEFISPECALHFERLGVVDQILSARPARLTETVFYSKNGSSVRVPSHWFTGGDAALGLSRAEMDERLLRRAADVGVEIREDSQVVNLILEDHKVTGATIRSNGAQESFTAPLAIDATGRTRALAHLLGFRKRRAGEEGHRWRRLAWRCSSHERWPHFCFLAQYHGQASGDVSRQH